MMRGYGGHPGWDNFGGHWSGVGIAGMVLMIILWIAVIAAIVLAIRALVIHSRRNRLAVAGAAGAVTSAPFAAPRPGAAPSSLLAILEERYARGEITRDDFLQRRADLGLGAPPDTPVGG